MPMRPLDSARLHQIARDAEQLLSNYDHVNSEADYEKLRKGVGAWYKANLEKGGFRDLMKYLRERVEYTAKDVDRQMEVFRKKAWPLFELETSITQLGANYEMWPRVRRRWKDDVTKAINGLPEVGAWLDKLHKDKKRDLKPGFAESSEQNVSIDGFHMIFHEYDEADPTHRAFLNTLTDALKTYQQKAKRYLPQMLRRKLPMDVMFGAGHSSGNYGDGRITLYHKAMKDEAKIVYTIAHETGHYFGLDWISHPARAYWIAAIKQDMKPIKLSEMLAKWPRAHSGFMQWMNAAIHDDPVLGMQLQAIWDGHVKMPKGFVDADNWTREGLEQYLETHGDAELRIMGTPITPYANENPDEAFAEAIALLVAYGPQAVHPQVREWLKVVLPGEIKLAYQSDNRALTRQVLARFDSAIDKSAVDRWKRDLKVMTKIYKDIEPPTSDSDAGDRTGWDQAQQLFTSFRLNFEEWAYKELLPKETSDHPWSPMEKQIAKLAWDVRYELDAGMLFPVIRPSRTPDWGRFRADRDRTIKRYQAAANKAFKAITEYLDTRPEGKVQRREPVEHFEVSGVGVVIHNTGRSGETGAEVALEAFLRRLKSNVDQVKRAGFAAAVRGLTVTVDFDVKKSEWDTMGRFMVERDELIMYPLGLVGAGSGHGTFTHECGHRFYFKALPMTARNEWEEVMGSRSVEITKEDVETFFDLVSKQVASKGLAKTIDRPDLLKLVLSHARDESQAAKFRVLAETPLIAFGESSVAFVETEYMARLERNNLGEKVQLEEISDYANTSPVEAFAEVFKAWVLHGPRAVGPWTREFFAKICKLGGAKIASRRRASGGIRGELMGPNNNSTLSALKVAARYQRAAVTLGDIQNLADDFGVELNLPQEGQAFSWDDNDSMADALLDDDTSLTPDTLPAVKVAARYQEKKKVPKANGKGTTEVYVYSEKQVETRNREKAKRLEKFKGKVEKLRSKVKANLGSEDRETRLVALAIALIDETHERVGNEESAKGNRNDSGDPHYGVTGWKKKHVSLGSGSATIKYVGKSGVKHEKTVSTPYVLKALRRAYKEAEGKDGCLFSGDDATVTAEKVNEFLAPFDITAKDLRGLAANSLMQKALKKVRKGTLPSDKAEREKQLKEEFKEALELVSDELGHEASTLKSQYLAPSMEDSYLKDGTIIDKLHEKKATGSALPPFPRSVAI